MPFLSQIHIKSGALSFSGFFDFYPQMLSPGNENQPNFHDRKEYLTSPEKERAWNILSFCRTSFDGSTFGGGLFDRRLFGGRLVGSMTIEAALCLTVFLIFMVSLCQLFLLMQLQLRIQKALEQVGNEAAQYSYLSSQVNLWESESRLLTKIEEYLLAELSEEAVKLRFVEVLGPDALEHSVLAEGADGLSLEESRILREGHRLRLVVSYQVRLPVALLGFGNVTLRQQCYRYAMLGDQAPAKEKEEKPDMVYVTKYGEVYHKALTCSHLKLSIRKVPMEQVDELRNDNGGTYSACELCEPTGWELLVYITSDGDRFHEEGDCSGLRRHISSIPLEEVGELRPCSRCGEE